MGGNRWRWLSRDLVMFVVGLGGFVHELVGPVERPSILAACVGLMSYPAVAGFDRRRNGSARASDNESVPK